MYHDISKTKQTIFVFLFSSIAILGPVLGVSSSSNFGIRATMVRDAANIELPLHSEFFCSGWAGSCAEEKLKKKINLLLDKS